MQHSTGEDGQALVETAVVVPLFLFMFLVILQLMILAHGRVMLDYAAFNAARAGVVHNGNNGVMRSAAMASVLPIFGDTSTLPKWAATWAKVAAVNIVGTALNSVLQDTFESSVGAISGGKLNVQGMFPGLELVEVSVVNPGPGDFGDGPNPDEIDLDLPQQTSAGTDALAKTRLSIRVRILYPLRIPVADRLLFYAFMAAMYFDAQETNDLATTDWLNPRMRSNSGGATVSPEQFVRQNEVPTVLPDRPLQLLNDLAMYQALKRIPDIPWPGFYVIPMYAYYSMPMESNFYRQNLH